VLLFFDEGSKWPNARERIMLANTGLGWGHTRWSVSCGENEILQSGTAPGPNKEFASGQKLVSKGDQETA
jgi:hypothetical protein